MITLEQFQQVLTQLDAAQKTIADLEAVVAKLKKTKLNKGVMSSDVATWEVFPTHVGVNRRSRAADSRVYRIPHTRGGEPLSKRCSTQTRD
jgi:hypothetical protein